MKIALLGYGKMGQTIERLARDQGHEIVYTASSQREKGSLKDADVAIEFSVPEAAVGNLQRCFEKGIPVVCGTTGWLDHYQDVVTSCRQRNGSLLYASNFSVGVNLFFHINQIAAKLLAQWPDYEVSIEEIHHTQKKDAPSGTAITLAEDILEHNANTQWKLDEQGANILTITAKREADVKGTHTVTYASEIDTLTITHQAHTRDGFAQGAILAANWLKGKQGIFTMKDVLTIKD
jgi:4-hydroxy-tetrahydrodipicolinate reductase